MEKEKEPEGIKKCEKCNLYLIPFGDTYLHPLKPCTESDGWAVKLMDTTTNKIWEDKYGAPGMDFQEIIEIKDMTIKEAVDQAYTNKRLKEAGELALFEEKIKHEQTRIDEKIEKKAGDEWHNKFTECNILLLKLKSKWFNRFYFWLKKHGKT